MATARKNNNTIERKIFFYRVDGGLDDVGRPLPFDVAGSLAAVNKLSWSSGDRYLPDSDGNDVCCWIESKKDKPRLRIGRIRRSGLPPVEEAGRLATLPIKPSEGLAETAHVAFFPNDGVVGMEFNFYAPRAS